MDAQAPAGADVGNSADEAKLSVVATDAATEAAQPIAGPAEPAATETEGLTDGQEEGSERTAAAGDAPRYQCHKKVSAFKIASVILSDAGIVTKIIAVGDERRKPLAVPNDWHKRYAGTDTDHGYFVLYAGGYASWSPSKEFEDGYTLIRDLSEQTETKGLTDGQEEGQDAGAQQDTAAPGTGDPDGSPAASADAGNSDAAADRPAGHGATDSLEEDDAASWKLDVAELARATAGGARLFANGGLAVDYEDVFSRDEAAIMADFVRDNPDAPVEAMFIHLGLKKRYPRTEPNTADLFVLSLFHAACRAAIKFEADQASAEAAAKAKPEPSGGWPGERALQPQKPALSPSGFSPR
ncbi:MAG: hypothetical protein EOS02_09900 [Mesorhizobium sp.]|nr:MAG: hypothetical protein EOS02_09900 [Mesorhizobium sp.]